jgi:hypothetical protein
MVERLGTMPELSATPGANGPDVVVASNRAVKLHVAESNRKNYITQLKYKDRRGFICTPEKLAAKMQA